MFVVLLKFDENRGQAGDWMDGHNAWIQQGFDDGVFLLAGSLQPGLGGAILAHHSSAEDLQTRIEADPFVANRVVAAEIVEIAPGRVDPRLEFLRA